jgi:hypothetical protein
VFLIVHIDCATHRAFADVEKRGSSVLGHFKRPIGRLMRLPVPVTAVENRALVEHHRLADAVLPDVGDGASRMPRPRSAEQF